MHKVKASLRRDMCRGTTMVTVLMTLLLATTLATSGVAAQEGSVATAGHPIVGSWLIDSTPEDQTDPLEWLTLGADGILAYGGLEGSGVGSWAATGERSADASIFIMGADPATGQFGYETVRAKLEVSEDGQTIAGAYTESFPSPFAEQLGVPPDGELGPGELTGERIAVEPMGEPVGPIPGLEELMPAEA